MAVSPNPSLSALLCDLGERCTSLNFQQAQLSTFIKLSIKKLTRALMLRP